MRIGILKRLAIVLVCIGAASPALAQTGFDTGEVWTKNQAAIAKITVTYTSEDGQRFSQPGSGFIVDRSGHLVTAGHVLKPPEGVPIPAGQTPRIDVWLGERDDMPAIKAHRVPMALEGDIAILKLPEPGSGVTPPWPFLSLARQAEVPGAAQLLAIGFPDGGSFSPTIGTLGGNAETCSGRRASRWFGGTLEAGASGGPVFDKLGRVFAIVEGGQAIVCPGDDFGTFSSSTTRGLIQPVEALDFCRAPVTCTYKSSGGAMLGDIGNLNPNDGRPWYQRLAAGAGSVAAKRFGVSMRDLERVARDDPENVGERICGYPDDAACVAELKQAAERGDPYALTIHAALRMYGVSDPEAQADILVDGFNELEDAARQEFPFAQMMVGILLLDEQAGQGMIGSDPARGKKLLESALAQKWGGAGLALLDTAKSRPDLIGELPDVRSGLDLAVERGLPAGQYELGMRLVAGNDHPAEEFRTERNVARGLDLLARASDSGFTDASSELGYIYLGRTNLTDDFVTAVNYPRAYQQFAKCDYLPCEFMVAAMMFNGDGVPQDKARAMEKLQRLANLGFRRAQDVVNDVWDAGGPNVVGIRLSVY